MKRRSFIKTGTLATAGLGIMASLNPVESLANLLPSEGFSLPKLPYSYSALEPFVDELTMNIHHSRHHAAYITKLNEEMAKLIGKPGTIEEICANISNYNTAVRNNAGGHYNHSFFWQILAPVRTTEISANATKLLDENFGSVEQFKADFRKTALSVFGSGWAWLVQDADGKLKIGTTPNQDNPLMDISKFKGKPIMALDVWEHAYYLKHQNKRADYIDGWWQVINWKQVDLNLAKV